MRKIEIPKDYLEDMYCNQHLTLREIASELGVNRQTISNKLQEYGLTVRNSEYIRKQKRGRLRPLVPKEIPKYRIKEDFEKVYSELKSLDLVAKYYNINLKTACEWKHKHNIPTVKSYSFDGVKKRFINKPYADRETLIEAYSKYSTEDLGKMWSCHPSTIVKWLKKFDIPTRTSAEQWELKDKFGVTVFKDGEFDMQAYHKCFIENKGHLHKKVMKFIKDLYGKCENPNCNESEVLDIHHIDENHNNNLPENHGVLCPNCHAKIHRLGLSFSDLVPNHISWEDILKNSYQEAK